MECIYIAFLATLLVDLKKEWPQLLNILIQIGSKFKLWDHAAIY